MASGGCGREHRSVQEGKSWPQQGESESTDPSWRGSHDLSKVSRNDIVPAVGKQRAMIAGSQFIQSWTPGHGTVWVVWLFSPQLIQTLPPRCVQGFVLSWLLDPVKLRILTITPLISHVENMLIKRAWRDFSVGKGTHCSF